MKISCCCFTLIIGEDRLQEAEEERLLDNDVETEEPIFSPRNVTSPTPASLEADHEDKDAQKAAGILQKNKVDLTQKPKNPDIRRAVGILKKYKLSTKQDGSDSDHAQLLHNVDLTISIKIMARSDTVKIFVVEASNVLPVIRDRTAKDPETTPRSSEESKTSEELLLVQVRTKLMHSEIRGHSKKYEVYEGLTGAMKFSNECIHTISISDFLSQPIRFRFYNVFKQKRDILLGEYILDTAGLNLEIENGTTSVLLHLHETAASSVQPPEKFDHRRMLSSSSAAGSSGHISVTPTKSLKSTIRRSDVRPTTRKSIPFFSQTSETDVDHKSQAGSPSYLESLESASPVNQKKQSDSHLQQLMKGVNERGENVDKLQSATEDMANEASTLSEMSSRIREKYQKKASKKKLLK